MKRLFVTWTVLGVFALAALAENSSEDFERLKSELTLQATTMQDFDRMAEKARKQGLPEIDIAGAALANAVSKRDYVYLEANLEHLGHAVEREDSPQEYRLYRQLGIALLAAEKGDLPKAEAAFKEAFWIAPTWGDAIGEILSQQREKERLKKIRVPMTAPLFEGPEGPLTLTQAMGERKASLIYFWAIWCGACRNNLPYFAEAARDHHESLVQFISVNTDPETRAEADAFLKKKARGLTPYTTNEGDTLPALLEVKGIPSVALVSSTGEVLFFGHPEHPDLYRALEAFDRNLTNDLTQAAAKP